VKTAVVYKTVYGSTGKYANWLKNSLKAVLFEIDKVKVDQLKPYKRLIVMSGTYAARMPLTGFLKKNWDAIKDKDIIIVAVGAAPEDNLWSKISYWLIPGKVKKGIKKYFKIYGQMPNSAAPEIKKENLKRVIDYLKN